MKEGLVLFAHGSRDPEWAQPFERIAVAVRGKLPAVAVGLAFLEYGPSLEEVVSALVAKGAGTIRVVPVFLGHGVHVKEDLPRLAAAAARADVKIHLDQPIGEQPEIIEAIAAIIAATR